MSENLTPQSGGNGGDFICKSSENNMILQPGSGYRGPGFTPGHDGDFIFKLADGREMMRITGHGIFIVEGREVTQDMEVYQAFRTWFFGARVVLEKGHGGGATDAIHSTLLKLPSGVMVPMEQRSDGRYAIEEGFAAKNPEVVAEFDRWMATPEHQAAGWWSRVFKQ